MFEPNHIPKKSTEVQFPQDPPPARLDFKNDAALVRRSEAEEKILALFTQVVQNNLDERTDDDGLTAADGLDEMGQNVVTQYVFEEKEFVQTLRRLVISAGYLARNPGKKLPIKRAINYFSDVIEAATACLFMGFNVVDQSQSKDPSDAILKIEVDTSFAKEYLEPLGFELRRRSRKSELPEWASLPEFFLRTTEGAEIELPLSLQPGYKLWWYDVLLELEKRLLEQPADEVNGVEVEPNHFDPKQPK